MLATKLYQQSACTTALSLNTVVMLSYQAFQEIKRVAIQSCFAKQDEHAGNLLRWAQPTMQGLHSTSKCL